MSELTLQERVQKMLEGETKRREVALKWLDEVKEILLPVSEHLWGNENNAVSLLKIKEDGKKVNTSLYFKYIEETRRNKNDSYGVTEESGFYMYEKDGYSPDLWGGKEIEFFKGSEFWYTIQIILNWIPQVIEAMDKREESRQQLLNKINL